MTPKEVLRSLFTKEFNISQGRGAGGDAVQADFGLPARHRREDGGGGRQLRVHLQARRPPLRHRLPRPPPGSRRGTERPGARPEHPGRTEPRRDERRRPAQG